MGRVNFHGNYRASSLQPLASQLRKSFAKAGFKVGRFTDDEVLKNISGVISELERVMGDIENSTPLIPRRRGQVNISLK